MDWKWIRRKLRRFIRKYSRQLLAAAVMAILIAAAVLMPAETEAPKGNDYAAFLDALGMRESSDDYTKVNRYGYMGRYQMGISALEDAGFRIENGGWSTLAHSYGIYDKEDFLNSPEGQDAAVTAYHRKVCAYIRHYGLEKYIGSTYCGVTVTRSGLLAACHLVGIGGIMDGLETGEPVRDGNNVPASEYMELFAGYDISAVWENGT